jgi:hypothetical protein
MARGVGGHCKPPRHLRTQPVTMDRVEGGLNRPRTSGHPARAGAPLTPAAIRIGAGKTPPVVIGHQPWQAGGAIRRLRTPAPSEPRVRREQAGGRR